MNTIQTYKILDSIADPGEIPVALYQAAQECHDSASELSHAWQQASAGKPWIIVAEELEKAAERVEKRLKKHWSKS